MADVRLAGLALALIRTTSRPAISSMGRLAWLPHDERVCSYYSRLAMGQEKKKNTPSLAGLLAGLLARRLETLKNKGERRGRPLYRA